MPRRALGGAAMTSAERQAKRREQFRKMREALERIVQAKTVKEARNAAQAVLSEIVH